MTGLLALKETPMVTMPCTGQSEARGRNRWFHLAEAERTLFHQGHADEARLCLDLFSHRRGQSAPVIVMLTAADATALAQALQAAAQQLAAVLRGSAGTRGESGRHRPSRGPARRLSLHPACARGGQASTTEARPPHPAPVGWGQQRPPCRCRGSTR